MARVDFSTVTYEFLVAAVFLMSSLPSLLPDLLALFVAADPAHAAAGPPRLLALKA